MFWIEIKKNILATFLINYTEITTPLKHRSRIIDQTCKIKKLKEKNVCNILKIK